MSYVGVKGVRPEEDYRLVLLFENGEERVLDLAPLLELDSFRPLRDREVFRRVRVSFDTIEWPGIIDIDPEFLYKNSSTIH